MIKVSQSDLFHKYKKGIIRDADSNIEKVRYDHFFSDDFIKDCKDTHIAFSMWDSHLEESQNKIQVKDVIVDNMLFAVNMTFIFPDVETEAFVKLKWF